MANRIEATFQSAGNIGLDTFRGTGGEEFRGVTDIRVGNKTFRVRIADDDRVSVSFATTSFFHLFQGSAKTAVRQKVQELVDNYRLAKDIGRAVALTSHSDNVDAMMRQQADSISRNAVGGRLAHYGFSTVRESSTAQINRVAAERQQARGTGAAPDITHQLINNYNVGLGLRDNVDAATTIVFVRDNNTDSWPLDDATGDGISAADREAWRRYLKGNDVDLFSKIRLARQQAENTDKTTGWAGEIRRNGLQSAVLDMVRKNLDPRVIAGNPDANFVLRAVADAVIEAADADFAGKTLDEVKGMLREIVGRHAPQGRGELTWKIFNEAATSAFWRQTSKLGLDFFKGRGETVVFEWSKFDGRETDGAELGDKWWKDATQDVSDHFGVAITNSEMRHLQSDKYAARPGAGTVIRVRGGVSAETAERAVMDRIAGLQSMDKDDLKAYNAELKANMKTLKAKDFYETALKVIANIPNGHLLMDKGWLEAPGELSDEGKGAIGAILENVLDRISDTKSLVTQTAMMSSIGELFEAELMNTPDLADLLGAEGNAPERAAPSDAVMERRLAGVGRGLGASVFFESDSGHPNALGRMVIAEARRNGNDIGRIVKELTDALSESLRDPATLEIPENLRTLEDILCHKAFKTFLGRAATRHEYDGYEKLMNSLGTVRAAYGAKTVLEEHLAAKANVSPKAREVFARRGDWDLNRLVFKAAERPGGIDANALESLRHKADVILDICQRAADYADEIERMLGTELTPAERNRVVDSYMDREGSAVMSFRLIGDDDSVANFDQQHQKLLGKSRALLDALRIPENGDLGAASLKALFLGGLFTGADTDHVRAAAAMLRATHGAEPIALPNAGTNEERIAAFRQALGDRIQEAFKSIDGYDDRNKTMGSFFSAYLLEHPETKAFLDRTIDGDVVAWLTDNATLLREEHSPIALVHLTEVLAVHRNF